MGATSPLMELYRLGLGIFIYFIMYQFLHFFIISSKSFIINFLSNMFNFNLF